MLDAPYPQEIWDHEITASEPTSTDWLWHGFLAKGLLEFSADH